MASPQTWIKFMRKQSRTTNQFRTESTTLYLLKILCQISCETAFMPAGYPRISSDIFVIV